MFFKEVHLKSDAWHWKIQIYVLGEAHRFSNFCPYFWTVIGCLLVFIPVFLGKQAVKGLMWVGARLEKLIDPLEKIIGWILELITPKDWLIESHKNLAWYVSDVRWGGQIGRSDFINRFGEIVGPIRFKLFSQWATEHKDYLDIMKTKFDTLNEKKLEKLRQDELKQKEEEEKNRVKERIQRERREAIRGKSYALIKMSKVCIIPLGWIGAAMLLFSFAALMTKFMLWFIPMLFHLPWMEILYTPMLIISGLLAFLLSGFVVCQMMFTYFGRITRFLIKVISMIGKPFIILGRGIAIAFRTAWSWMKLLGALLLNVKKENCPAIIWDSDAKSS